MNVLLTGAAGFIGFHFALFLKALGNFVIGLDNFNPYYDVKLKRDRAALLQKKGVEVIEGDIRDKNLLKKIIHEAKISHVVHLAAQAGVRYSFDHPDEYVAYNVDGFVSILEAIKSTASVKLLFASSSSVYGNNKKVPFSESDTTDSPANLYGATKKADELIAYAYYNLFGIESTALRYFTVYGPWGRPDMAYFSFSKAILEGKSISLFNNGEMRRDFTYITDIIEGSYQALLKIKGFDIFNLGNNRPENLLYFINILEKELNKKATLQFLPLPKGEMVETCADIGKAKKQLNFQPKVKLSDGLHHFISWYKEYSS